MPKGEFGMNRIIDTNTNSMNMSMFGFKDTVIENMKLASALKYRTIYLCETVSDDACFKLNYFLDRLVRIDNKKGTKEKITIVVDSFGGSIYAGLSSISRVEKMKEDGYIVETIVDGKAMSMGSALSQCGTKGHRKAMRYATFLYHQPSSYTVGTLKEMITDVDEVKRLWELMKDISKRNTDLTEEILEDMYNENKDVYFTPEEMLELGVIDEIL